MDARLSRARAICWCSSLALALRWFARAILFGGTYPVRRGWRRASQQASVPIAAIGSEQQRDQRRHIEADDVSVSGYIPWSAFEKGRVVGKQPEGRIAFRHDDRCFQAGL